MNILDYAIAKKMFGGSGSGEVSGTIEINENGTYNVAKYAHANVNIPIGVAIEVSELPEATADCVGKVYKVGEDYYVGDTVLADFAVGETLGDKIYFDTSVNIADYGSVIPAGEMTPAFTSTSDTARFMLIVGELLGGGEQGTCYVVVSGEEYTNTINTIYAQCDALTVEQFNEMLAPQLGLPAISNFGWQTDVLDTSEYADCIVEENYLSEVGNFARKSGDVTFKNLDNPPILQEKTVTENGEVVADSGFDGLSKVTVNVASSGGEAQATLNAVLDGSITEIESDVTYLNQYAFAYQVNLKTVNFPNFISGGTYIFRNCTALTTANFPNAQTIVQSMFETCNQLKLANFPSATTVRKSAFSSCQKLIKLIVGTNNTTVATLENTNAFQYCYHILGTVHSSHPTGAKDGYIYVPHSLVADYRVATNWATYATQIMPYVATVGELANIDGTTYDKACVGADYVEYTYNGTSWEVYR